MKIEKREVVSYREVYVANDGTDFLDKDECSRYEKTCGAILKANAFRCKLDTDVDGEFLMNSALFGMSCDDKILVFDIKTNDDLDDVNKYLNYYSGGFALALDRKYIGQKVAIDNYCDDTIYVLGTMDDILDRVRKTFEPCFEEKKKDEQ